MYQRENSQVRQKFCVHSNMYMYQFTLHSFLVATSTGLLRLTPEGTTFFNNLNRDGKDNFFNEILRELSEVIPIDIKRLSTSKRHQSDPRAMDQIRFPITIKSPNDPLERTVQQVINDLDTLVRNKGITPISFKGFTSYLDSTYGFQPTRNYECSLFKFFFRIMTLDRK